MSFPSRHTEYRNDAHKDQGLTKSKPRVTASTSAFGGDVVFTVCVDGPQPQLEPGEQWLPTPLSGANVKLLRDQCPSPEIWGTPRAHGPHLKNRMNS